MTAIDATKRPLKVPARFVPYLEKHNIFALFHSLASSIIIKKPDDILQFMKNEINRYRTISSPRSRRIIFIAPPHLAIGLQSMGAKLASIGSLEPIYLKNLVEEFDVRKDADISSISPKKLAEAALACIKRIELEPNNGWILLGFPQTKEEARALQKLGILPTHTFQITHDPNDYEENDFWNANLSDNWTYEGFSRMMKDYKRKAVELRQVYASTLKTIVVRGRTVKELENSIFTSLKKFDYDGIPFAPRVVLLGMRGSRRRTLARMLNKKMDLVHIHFWDLIAQARQCQNEVGDMIKESSDLYGCIHMSASLDILEKRFLSADCLRNGWVLTGFPNDECDFRNLDALSTPPNKVIFLEVPGEICYNRLRDRCINMHTGEVLSKSKIAGNAVLQRQIARHPHDNNNVVTIEQKNYLAEYHSLVEYKMSKAIFVNAEGSLFEVFERLEDVIVHHIEPLPSKSKGHTSLSMHAICSENTRDWHSFLSSQEYGDHDVTRKSSDVINHENNDVITHGSNDGITHENNDITHKEEHLLIHESNNNIATSSCNEEQPRNDSCEEIDDPAILEETKQLEDDTTETDSANLEGTMQHEDVITDTDPANLEETKQHEDVITETEFENFEETEQHGDEKMETDFGETKQQEDNITENDLANSSSEI